MKPLFLIVFFMFLSSSFGRHIASRWLLLCDRPLERYVFSSAIGLGVIAYGVLALGLLGLLSIIPICLFLLLIGMIGIPGIRENLHDFRQCVIEIGEWFRSRRVERIDRFITLSSLAIFSICGLFAVLACFLPPNSNAWDALSYHLADPKIYLANHKIVLLPTQHHSNFPFTMEMLFTIGLLFDSYVLANLFHLLTLVLLCLGMLAFCRRFLNEKAGWVSIATLITTPLILWEGSIAYIDIGLSFYIFLAFYAVIAFVEARRMSSISTLSCWIWLTGISMGFAMGIKYLAILPLGFILIFMLASRVPVKLMLRYLAIALVIGSPWYIKNVVWMSNPVYPFAYSAFPHSRYWSEDRAKPYSEEQRSFGHEHSIANLPESTMNLAMSPWNLTSQYWRPNVQKQPNLFTNVNNFTFTSLIGGLGLACFFALAFVNPLTRVIKYLAVFAGMIFISWFFVSQHIRYLIPMAPILSLFAGFVVTLPFERGSLNRWKLVGIFAGGAVVLQIVQFFIGVFLLPTGGRDAADTLTSGLAPTAFSIPEIVSEFSEGGHQKHLQGSSGSYQAISWINQNTPPDAGVLLIEEVLGFNLNRSYLWGNEGHSSYIPYDSFLDGGALSDWMLQHKIRYALINMRFADENHDPSLLSDDLLETQSRLLSWYYESPKRWKSLYGDALKRGRWTVVFANRGVAVLRMDEARQ